MNPSSRDIKAFMPVAKTFKANEVGVDEKDVIVVGVALKESPL